MRPQIYAPRIRSSPQQCLDEKLVVEDARRRVKGCSRDGGVNIVSRSDRVPRGRYDARLEDANVAYEVSKATTASGPNPASSKRSSMVSTLSAGYSRYIVSYLAIQKTRVAHGMVQGLSNPVQGAWPWDGQAGTQALAHRDNCSRQRQRRTECWKPWSAMKVQFP